MKPIIATYRLIPRADCVSAGSVVDHTGEGTEALYQAIVDRFGACLQDVTIGCFTCVCQQGAAHD
jgi:hypothetical protein